MKYKPTLRQLLDLVKDTDIGIINKRLNVIILRGKQSSLSVFYKKQNDLEKLKQFMYDNLDDDTNSIDVRIHNILAIDT